MVSQENKFDLAIGWNGLPAYGAELIAAGRKELGYDFPVVGTPPDVPIHGMEQILGGDLRWIEKDKPVTWADLQLLVPKLFIHTGWAYDHFNSLAREVKSRNGYVVGMFDNCWKGSIRQLVGSVYFRLFLSRRFDSVWVPGKSGQKLARNFGVPDSDIYTGLYGASHDVFCSMQPISQRKKQILFVGRLDHRKGVLPLAEAFKSVQGKMKDWQLLLVGDGPCLDELRQIGGISILPFKQPEEISRLMNESRTVILPSREEHWGLVVHEAVLCGCPVVVQKRVGSVPDLTDCTNSVLINETNVESIAGALLKISKWSDEQFEAASSRSVQLAANFGTQHWLESFGKIVSRFISPASSNTNP